MMCIDLMCIDLMCIDVIHRYVTVVSFNVGNE